MNTTFSQAFDRYHLAKLIASSVQEKVDKTTDLNGKIAAYRSANKWIAFLLATGLPPAKEEQRVKTVSYVLNTHKEHMREKRKKYLICLLKKASAHARIHISDEGARKATIETYDHVLADLARTDLTPAEKELQAQRVNSTLSYMTKSGELEKLLGSSK
jgi:hypothetical protein